MEDFSKLDSQNDQPEILDLEADSSHIAKSDSIQPANKIGKNQVWLFLLDIVLNVVVIVLLVFLIRTYLIAPFRVFGPSMCNTLNYIDNRCAHGNGEYIIVNKLIYQRFFNFEVGQPKRGDVIVFIPPTGGKDFFIKRIIGLPGEKVEFYEESGQGFIYIHNGENSQGFKLDEPYLSAKNQGQTFVPRSRDKLLTVPEDSYFVMGDNRQESSDSRHCFEAVGCTSSNTPFLPRKNIEGKAWLVLWPFGGIRAL